MKLRKRKQELKEIAERSGHTLDRFTNYGDMAKTFCLTCGCPVDTDFPNAMLERACPSPNVRSYLVIADTIDLIAITMGVKHKFKLSEVNKIVKQNGGTTIFGFELEYDIPEKFKVYHLGD